VLVLEANGQLNSSSVELEHRTQVVNDLLRATALPVQLVDERNPRHVVPLHLPVHGERLRLHTGHAAENEHAAVENAEGALDLDGKVHVPRRVDDVDVVLASRVLPLAKGRRGLDSDALLPLELHGVHLRADAVLAAHVVNGVDAPGVVQDALGQGSLKIMLGLLGGANKAFSNQVCACVNRVSRTRGGTEGRATASCRVVVGQSCGWVELWFCRVVVG